MDQNIDLDRIEDAVIALPWLAQHDGWRAWQSFNRDVMDRQHQKPMVSDPVGTTEAPMFIAKDRGGSERQFPMLFARRA
jgi:hypothetical protein